MDLELKKTKELARAADTTILGLIRWLVFAIVLFFLPRKLLPYYTTMTPSRAEAMVDEIERQAERIKELEFEKQQTGFGMVYRAQGGE